MDLKSTPRENKKIFVENEHRQRILVASLAVECRIPSEAVSLCSVQNEREICP